LFLPGYWIDRAAAARDAQYAKWVYRCVRDTCNTQTPGTLADQTADDGGGGSGQATVDATTSGKLTWTPSAAPSSESSSTRRQMLRSRRLGSGVAASGSSRANAGCYLLSNFSAPECGGDALNCAEGSAGPM
jgi:hypothetical protein